jgi:hypothetical protein
MIGVFVTFQYDDSDFDRALLEKVASESRPMFEGMAGLRSKAFTIDEEARRATNFYVWDSDDAGREFFTPDLVELATGLYGADPQITFVDIALLVDNANG